MSLTGLPQFDRTVNRTNEWLVDVQEALDLPDDRRNEAYHALRAVLQALRDRITPGEATDLGAQLPMLVRGFYYEGYKPANKPVDDRDRAAFLRHVSELFPRSVELEPERAATAVFRVLQDRIAEGEIEDLEQVLPANLRSFFSAALSE